MHNVHIYVQNNSVCTCIFSNHTAINTLIHAMPLEIVMIFISTVSETLMVLSGLLGEYMSVSVGAGLRLDSFVLVLGLEPPKRFPKPDEWSERARQREEELKRGREREREREAK